MKKSKTTIGKTYAVTSPNGCTVTSEDGLTLAEIEAGKQGYFVAVGSNVTLSDASAILTPVFKLAPCQKLRLLGVVGGDKLPSGYTRVAYLQSTGTQYIAIKDIQIDNDLGGRCDYVDFYAYSDAPMLCGTRTVNGAPRFYLPYTSNGTSYYGWNDWVELGAYNNAKQRTVSLLNYFNDRKYKMSYGDTVLSGTLNNTLPVVNNEYLSLFCYNSMQSLRYVTGRVYSVQLTRSSETVCSFIPALDPTGTPCMFDAVTRKPFRNDGSGHFIAGVETQKQLDAVLRMLPDLTGQDGGELHLCLSDELYESAVASGIIEATATAKNWQIAYDPTTEIAA